MRPKPASLFRYLPLLLLSLFALPAAAAGDIERQRELFLQVHDAAERGDWRPVDALEATDRKLLETYVLWPDLRAAWIRAQLGRVPATDVDAYLDTYGTLRPARELRYRYALKLAEDGKLDAFFKIYERFYQGLGVARLDCYALQAELAAGRERRVTTRALDLWLTGNSQVDECNPVFEHLRDKGLLGPEQYRARFALAIEAREFTLARWLARSIDDEHVAVAETWLRAQSRPEAFLRAHAGLDDSDESLKQLAYAAERLTYGDPVLARKLWRKVAKRHTFSEQQRAETARHIALWTARDALPGAYDLLVDLPASAQNDEVMRWRARTSLRNGRWVHLVNDIVAMSDTERDTEEWRYWHALALQRIGQVETAHSLFEALARERSYYGFLAADEIGHAYTFAEEPLVPDEAAIDALSSMPGLIRARELFLVGQDSRGRSEWDAAVEHLNDAQKLQAAILADRWSWHSRAIATVAQVESYDDLAIRYPLPYLTLFEQSSADASIATTWAYGIARSESLFMHDVRSRAGAIGLMQLMPATGRQVATELKLPYSGTATLTDPESNIRLGTTYLGQMAARYSGNAVAATAAYNAGPHRVDAWLPTSGTIDARIWIENIPFNETRGYVKRVLAAQTIFHWRMTGEVRRLSDELPSIAPVSGSRRLAAR